MRAHGVLTGTYGVLTGTHAQVLEQYYASLQRLGAQLDAALLKRREAERLLAAEAMPREYIFVCACVRACVRGRECVCVCACMRVCVCVCERERGRESVCLCVCACDRISDG